MTLEFAALDRLRVDLTSLLQPHVSTMSYYASDDERGFWHQPVKKEEASLSSTATCVASLVRARSWTDERKTWGSTKNIADELISKRESAGLDPNNAFSLSFIVEGILDLIEGEEYEGSEQHLEILRNDIVPSLCASIESPEGQFAKPGSVSITPYPPSAYLTQLAFRVIKRCIGELPGFAKIAELVYSWATNEINRQLALLSVKSKLADPLQLAYAIILAATARPEGETSPEEKSLIVAALRIFFLSQEQDGTWVPSQPLFHYPKVGNALCFEYELLSELLNCSQLQVDLLAYIPKIEITFRRLAFTAFDLGSFEGGRAVGWASGHHPQIKGPESWSTASVYLFAYTFERLVAEAIRRALFEELGSIYKAPRSNVADKRVEDFAPKFLDAPLDRPGLPRLKLKDTLRDRFVIPIQKERKVVASGGQLAPTTAMSAILFGPPGTSKTGLASMVSDFIEWPLLYVDPSYIVQDGLDNLYSRSNRLFSMLAVVEQVVVLLDEFDEMGRDREKSDNLLSRFITTSMLPKLAAINDARKIVFLLATNYVGQFDAAFSRGGRFDMRLQIMPPFAAAKAARGDWKPVFDAAFASITTAKKKDDAMKLLERLTVPETKQLVASLSHDYEDAFDEFESAAAAGTLSQMTTGEKTWADACVDEQRFNRIPAGPPSTPASPEREKSGVTPADTPPVASGAPNTATS